jgi:pSer/pThr/pTyr-binding forkhead associated (FHA) protein
VIVCPRCSKENQDHYKFCLGCGSELPREAAAPRTFSVRTPPSALPAIDVPAASSTPLEKSMQFAATQQGSLSNPPPRPNTSGAAGGLSAGLGSGGLHGHGATSGLSPAAGGSSAAAASPGFAPAVSLPQQPAFAPPRPQVSGPNNCPSCGNPVPLDFKFCGTCGHRMTGAAGPAAHVPAAAPSTTSRVHRGSLVVINPDGSEGDTFALSEGDTPVGRSAGAVFSADAYLSPLHATFTIAGATCSVRDENSLNGVYVKLKRDAPVKLQDGDVFRIGQEILRFESIPLPQLVQGVEPMGSPNPGYVGRLSLVIGRESTGNGYPIPPDGMHLGRERGDVVFPEDGYVSGLHCRVHYDGSGCVLTDVGSSNGTFVRVRGSRTILSGDLLLMGQQLFRVQL